MPKGRIWGAGLMVVGALTSTSAGLALLLSGLPYGNESVSSARPSPPSTATPSKPGSAWPGPPPGPDEVERFVDALFGAIERRDGAYLFAALDPRVLDLYGVGPCRRHTTGLTDPPAAAAVETVAGPEPWDWLVDGASVHIRKAYVVSLAQPADPGDEPSSRETHVGLSAKGLGWFTDCGTPRR